MADVVEINVTSRFKKQNRMTMEPVPAWQLKQEAEAKPIFVYNVSKHDKWNRNVPGMGKIVIPMCPENAEYSNPIIVKGMIRSYFDKGDRKKGYHYDEGIHVAKDLIGILSETEMQPYNNLEYFGVFWSEGRLHDDPGAKKGDQILSKEASEKLLKAANAKLKKKNTEHVAQADRYWRGDQRQRSFICQRHQEAANALNLKREWSASAIEEGPKTLMCDGCGENVKETAAFCGVCHMVNNEETCKRKKLKIVDGFVVIGGQAKGKKPVADEVEA